MSEKITDYSPWLVDPPSNETTDILDAIIESFKNIDDDILEIGLPDPYYTQLFMTRWDFDNHSLHSILLASKPMKYNGISIKHSVMSNLQVKTKRITVAANLIQKMIDDNAGGSHLHPDDGDNEPDMGEPDGGMFG